MTIFTNKSPIEHIPQDEINSDFGVLLFRSASFNKFDKSKYQNEDGTPNDLAVKKIYECLIHKHRSVFFGSRVMIEAHFPVDTYFFTKDELLGYNVSNIITDKNSKVQYREHFFTIYFALQILYFSNFFRETLGQSAFSKIEKQVQKQYPACYKALQMLSKENVTQEEKDLLEEQRAKFISFKAELPIFIQRQLARHRGINFTERSGRYTSENTRFYKPDNWRKAPEKATQGSVENEFVKESMLTCQAYTVLKSKSKTLIQKLMLRTEWFNFKLSYSSIVSLLAYWFNSNLRGSVCKEQARMILPQSQITTTINTVDLYTLSSVLSQRLDKHAQLEIREMAQQLHDIACQEFGKELVDRLIDIQSRLIF